MKLTISLPVIMEQDPQTTLKPPGTGQRCRNAMLQAAVAACADFYEGRERVYKGTYTGIYLRTLAILRAQDKITVLRAETPTLTPL